MKVTFTRRAQRDLSEIGSWIATDRPRAAVRMVDQIVTAGETLGKNSMRYPETLRSLRKRPVGSYLIFYRVLERVEIVRILHAARDWPTLLDEA